MKSLLLIFGVLFLPAAYAADPVCAKGYITLRKGPGADQPVSWKVARYMPFLRVDRKGAWSKLEDLEGETHWAKSSELLTNIRCVVVKTAVASLRSVPSTSGAFIDMKTADRYTPFKRLENQKDWLQIEDETGRKAWIHESQVWKPVSVNSIAF